MARAKRPVQSRRRRKKVLKVARGFYGGQSKLYRTARERVARAWHYAYRDRRVKKRAFRQLWITRIGAAVRAEGLSYSRFMHGLKQAQIGLDRKALSDLAIHRPEAFKDILGRVKANLPR